MLLAIGEVEQITGLSKDVLRKWESRYGFPSPIRNHLGIRLYSQDDIKKIQTIKSLLNNGEKISKIISLSTEELLLIFAATNKNANSIPDQFLPILEFSKNGDVPKIRNALKTKLDALGLEDFVLKFVAPLITEIGSAWHNDEISVAQEHFCTAEIIRVLTEANSNLPINDNTIKVILATPPQELHAVGLKMVESMLLLAGGMPIYLGVDTPLDQLLFMSQNACVDVVAISVSANYPLRDFRQFLKEISDQLPARIEIWVGGSGARKIKKNFRVKYLMLEDIGTNLNKLKFL
jgi:methanogenic corrinoid protein MtbC1